MRRPPRGVWAGLWSLPEFEEAAALEALVAGWPGEGQWLPAFGHALTHFDWTLQPLCWRLPAGIEAAWLRRLEGSLPVGRWVGCDEALSMGLPAPVRRLIAGHGNTAGA